VEALTVTPDLTMLRVKGWQVYVWRDGDSVTLIDTGAPGSGAEILSAVTRVDRIVLTHGHVDHTGSAAELHQATAAPVLAGAGDAAEIRAATALPPPVFEDWEVPIHQRVSVGLPETAPPVPVDRELVDGDLLDFGGGAEVLAVPATPKAASRSNCRATACCSPATPSPAWAPSSWAPSTRTGHEPRRRFGGCPPSTSRPHASVTANRSPREPVTGYARWLPH
jgi:hypothetical protein